MSTNAKLLLTVWFLYGIGTLFLIFGWNTPSTIAYCFEIVVVLTMVALWIRHWWTRYD